MEVRNVIKIGNSEAVTLPASVKKFMNLKEGDYVGFDLRGRDPTLFKVKPPKRMPPK